MSKFEKRRISLRYWLLGRQYFKALEAMDFAAKYHAGLRKDGVTPEFDHQISMAHFVRAFIDTLEHPEETLCAIFLHDTREDYDVPDIVIRSKWGDLVADAVDALTKVFRGVKRDPETVFRTIAANRIASVVKGVDRINNHETMVGVFTIAKQKEYMAETKRFFLPMLKTARKSFPRQEPIYESIKHMLESQMTLIDAIHQAYDEKSDA